MNHSLQPHRNVSNPTFNIGDKKSEPQDVRASPYYPSSPSAYSSDSPPTYNQVVYRTSSPRDFPTASPVVPQSSYGNKLVAIPATGHKIGSPIMRAWPPALEASGLSKDDFLQFIDRLNRVTVSSPPIQVLGLAGNIVGMVPLATAQIVGGAVNAGAMVAGAALRTGHTEILLRQANRDLFNPLGLNVKLAKMEAVAKLTNIPLFDASGRVDKNSRVLPPLNEIVGVQTIGAHQRRLMALQPYISPLSLDELPHEDKPTNYLARMHGAASARQAAKEEKNIIKKRDKKKGKSKKDKEEEALRRLVFLIVENMPKQSWDGNLGWNVTLCNYVEICRRNVNSS